MWPPAAVWVIRKGGSHAGVPKNCSGDTRRVGAGHQPAVSWLLLLHVCHTSACADSILAVSLFPVPAADGEDSVRAKLRAVNEELVERFRQLEEEFR